MKNLINKYHTINIETTSSIRNHDQQCFKVKCALRNIIHDSKKGKSTASQMTGRAKIKPAITYQAYNFLHITLPLIPALISIFKNK